MNNKIGSCSGLYILRSVFLADLVDNLCDIWKFPNIRGPATDPNFVGLLS